MCIDDRTHPGSVWSANLQSIGLQALLLDQSAAGQAANQNVPSELTGREHTQSSVSLSSLAFFRALAMVSAADVETLPPPLEPLAAAAVAASAASLAALAASAVT